MSIQREVRQTAPAQALKAAMKSSSRGNLRVSGASFLLECLGEHLRPQTPVS